MKFAQKRIGVLSLVSVALYVFNYLLQRSLFYGVPIIGRGTPATADLLWIAVLYAVVIVGLFAAYLAVLSACKRGEVVSGPARAWAIATPCLVQVLLVPCVPRFSQDLFSYLAHGALGVVPGGNPLLQVAEDARNTAFGAKLAAYGWDAVPGITPYGILWTQIEIGVIKTSGADILTALLLIKSIVVAASLGTAGIIWSFLGRTCPSKQLLGTLAYLWNPLLIIEFAGEGHNDAVMVFWVVAALAMSAARRPAGSLGAQWLGVLTKYVPLLFIAAQLIYLWRTRRTTAQLTIGVLAAVAVMSAITVVLYAPLWAGLHTFDGILSRGEPISSGSPFGVIHWILSRSPFAPYAAPLTVASVVTPLLALAAWASLQVRDAASLARAFAWTAVAYVLFASPDYWPWYACMPVALIAAADSARLLWLATLMSLLACLCAPLELLPDHGVLTPQGAKGLLTALGATVPLLALVVWSYVHRRRAHAQVLS